MGNRISYYDNLKFAVILLVVIGHMFINHVSVSTYIPSLLVFIYSFHMPLFIFISGLFHSNKDIIRRLLLLLSYLLIAKCLIFVENFISTGCKAITLLSEDGWAWYIVALICYSLITYTIRDFNMKYILVVAIVVGCVSGYDPNVMTGNLYGRLIVFYPFYIIGVLLNRYSIVSFIEEYRKKTIMVGTVILAAWGGGIALFAKKQFGIYGDLLYREFYTRNCHLGVMDLRDLFIMSLL